MNITNDSSEFGNNSILSSLESNSCPRQRSITRPLLFVHNYALVFFGSIFNFLAFIILIQRSLRCHSTFAYLAFLSLSNGVLSLLHFSKWMLQFYFSLSLGNNLLTCRFDRFSSDFLTHFSIITLICVNIDRARTVTKSRPNGKYTQSKFRMVLIQEFIIGSILCAFHFHWIIKYGSETFIDGNKEVTCGFHPNQVTSTYYFLLSRVYPPFELTVFFCFPLLINIFCTVLIVRSLRIRMHTAKQFRPSKSNLNDQTLPTKSYRLLTYFLPKSTSRSNVHSCLCFQIQYRRHTRMRLKLGRTQQSLEKYDKENKTIDREKSLTLSTCLSQDSQSQATPRTPTQILNKKHRARRTRDLHLSAMLIGLNILYILLNLPFNLHQTFAGYIHNINADPCNIRFVSVLLDSLQQTFFSTNFFLYVLTNRRFREELYNTITSILLHCRQTSSIKHLTNLNQTYRQRRSSCNPPSGPFHTVQTSDKQLIALSAIPYHDSLVSDIECTETSPTQQQQTIITLNEKNQCTSKLVVFTDSPTD